MVIEGAKIVCGAHRVEVEGQDILATARCPECKKLRLSRRERTLSCNLRTGEFWCARCGFHGVATHLSLRLEG